MATIPLLHALLPFQQLLNSVSKQLPVKSAGSVSLSYSTIKLKLAGTEANSPALYFQCVFQIQQPQVKLVNVYVEQKDKQDELTFVVNAYLPDLSFPTNKGGATYTPAVIRYLSIADAIARQGYQCSSGDDYRPGYYSEIMIGETQLTLKQINRYNSRSLDHHTDYHLRELEFHIPLSPGEMKFGFEEEAIGEMKVRFTDRSSPNNTTCGDRIRAQIEVEKQRFAQS